VNGPDVKGHGGKKVEMLPRRPQGDVIRGESNRLTATRSDAENPLPFASSGLYNEIMMQLPVVVKQFPAAFSEYSSWPLRKS
jgi:hypothetical protein